MFNNTKEVRELINMVHELADKVGYVRQSRAVKNLNWDGEEFAKLKFEWVKKEDLPKISGWPFYYTVDKGLKNNKPKRKYTKKTKRGRPKKK